MIKSREKAVYKSFKITELLLNPENPRFDPVNYQTEIIEAMVDDQRDKLVELAKHISDFGLSPIDILLVHKHEKQWVVWEGNRRLTALKLMNEPGLVPDQYTRIKREFQKLNAVLDITMMNSILCVIIEDKKIADEWIRLKHTGENRGVGTVNWDAKQTGRFSAQVRGVTDPKIAFFDFLRTFDSIPLKYRQNFSEIRKTNFDRLINDPDVRAFLGIVNNGDGYTLANGVSPQLLLVLQDLIFTDFSVGSIYLKEDRKNYLEEIRKRVAQLSTVSSQPLFEGVKEDTLKIADIPKTEGAQKTQEALKIGETKPMKGKIQKAHKIEGGDTLATDEKNVVKALEFSSKQTELLNTTGKGKARSYPINRKTLVPSHHKLPISHARILKIFNELKTLDCDMFTNSVAALFRVFIELSADCYIETKQNLSVTCESQLSQKINAVADDMLSKKVMTKNGLRAARQMASSPTQNVSVKTLHSYVHNKDVTPIPSDLRSAWDDLWPFIENLWR